MIAESVGAPENDGATALDDLRDSLAFESLEEGSNLETQAAPRPKHRRRRKSRAKPGAKRGRPAKVTIDLAGTGPTREPPFKSDGVLSGKKPPLKAEILEQLEQSHRELETLRARTDPNKLSELSKSLEALAIVGYGLIAEQRGPHWALSSEEAHRIGETSAMALAPYAEKLNQNIPWFAAVTTLAAVTFKRVQIDRRIVLALEARAE